jgi:anaerobic ribonucleoside-triphosphate reductase activating protein
MTLPLRLSAPPDKASVAHHSGPGLRVIFWVQGCALRCTRECLNPHLLTSNGGHLVDPQVAGRWLLAVLRQYADAEGVTVLGGEPFEQAAALAVTLRIIREAGYSTVVYSGHVYEMLRDSGNAGVQSLLREVDVLVDGPYLSEESDPSLVWRGSRNQRVLPLTDRYSAEQLEEAQRRQGRAMFVSHAPDGSISVSGLQSRVAAGIARRSAFRAQRRAR